jgi:peroxiredoxin
MAKTPDRHESAPMFEAVDVLGNKVKLSGIKQNYSLLVFLRYSGCPWCNLAIHRLALEYDQMRDYDCQIIALVQSAKELIMDNIYGRHELQPQYPIIADHSMEIYKKYHVSPSVIQTIKSILNVPYWVESVSKHGFKQKKIDGNFFMVPAWFLINNRTKKIVKFQRGASFYDHESFVQIYDSLIFKD